jgi:hypothetical protein
VGAGVIESDEEAAAARQKDAHVESSIDEETYDRLIASGEPERTARAKAKAAYIRKVRLAAEGGGQQ